MSRINLLPWRDQKRRLQNQRFYGLLGCSLGLCSILVTAIYLAIQHQIQIELKNIEFLEKEQKNIEIESKMVEDLEKDKLALINRIHIIQGLQEHRAVVVKLLDRLPRLIPQGVSLVSLLRKQDVIDLEGNANTNADVSQFLKNLEQSEAEGWLYQVKLKEILANKKEADLRFKIQCKLNL